MAKEHFEFADGVYFGLDDRLYRADPALGSTDHKALAMAPEAYWFGSVYNPARPEDKDTPARALGRGVHMAALEGIEAFKRRFIRRPDEIDRLTDKVRAVIAPRGETILPAEAYDRAALAAAQIRAHPDLAGSLTGGYSEVSVFWTVDIDGRPVRCKARIDYLKPRAIVDVKSIAIKRPFPFWVLCLRAISTFRYTIQADHYLQARAAIGEFIRNGQVDGDVDPAFLERCAAAGEDFAFVWIFWASDGPPLVWSGSASADNPILDDGKSQVIAARRNFANFRERFGVGNLWIDYQPLQEISPEDMELTRSSKHF